jgi:hypothetical protein
MSPIWKSLCLTMTTKRWKEVIDFHGEEGRYLSYSSRLSEIGSTSALALGSSCSRPDMFPQPKSNSTSIASHIVPQAMVVHVGLTCHQLVRSRRTGIRNAVGHVHYAGRSAMGRGRHVSRASRVASPVMGLVVGLTG